MSPPSDPGDAGSARVALYVRLPDAERAAVERWRQRYSARMGFNVTTNDAVRILLRAGLRAVDGYEQSHSSNQETNR